jgi:DNA-binding beta-propeller fold protein YncE
MLRGPFLGSYWSTSLLAFSLLCRFSPGTFAAPQGASYHVIRRMAVGGDGNWDYLRVDPDAHRIYISRQTYVMVVDENSGKVIGDIPDTKGVHGIALAPELGEGFTSNGGTASVTVFDLKTLTVVKQLKTTGDNPDSIIYDPQTKRVFTFNGRSSNVTAFDAATGMVAGTVTLAGKPEEAALDRQGNVFVNIDDKSAMQEFDAKTLTLKGLWPLAPCEGPSALSMDTTHRRLFAACDKVMVIVNADSGKVIASLPIGGDPDGNGYDPGTGFLFAACREGLISILHQDSADQYSVVANVTTQFGTRTMTIDLKTHHVFTVTADFKPAGPPTADNPRPRPQPIAGSFAILELAQRSQ